LENVLEKFQKFGPKTSGIMTQPLKGADCL